MIQIIKYIYCIVLLTPDRKYNLKLLLKQSHSSIHSIEYGKTEIVFNDPIRTWKVNDFIKKIFTVKIYESIYKSYLL